MYEFEKIKDVCKGYGNDFEMQIIINYRNTYMHSYFLLKKCNSVENINFRIVLTSNCVEAFNNNFAKKFDRPHTNMAQFIRKLQIYQGKWKMILAMR
jgi:predicted dinucleotide-binding enzyme